MTPVVFVTLLAVYTASRAWKAFPSWIIGCWWSCSYSTASGEVFAWPLSGLSFIYCQWVRVVHHTIFVVSRKNFYFPCTVRNIPLFMQSCMILFSNILAHCECDLNTKAHFLNSASYEGTGRSLSLKLLQQLEEQSQMSAKGPISGMLILHWACSYCFCLLYLWGWTKIPFSQILTLA